MYILIILINKAVDMQYQKQSNKVSHVYIYLTYIHYYDIHVYYVDTNLVNENAVDVQYMEQFNKESVENTIYEGIIYIHVHMLLDGCYKSIPTLYYKFILTLLRK